LRMFKQLAAGHEFKRRFQLFQKLLRLDELGFALRGAIDLAIDAIEIADFVGVQIHADRNALAPPAEDRIDEPVLFEPAWVAGVERNERHEWEVLNSSYNGAASAPPMVNLKLALFFCCAA
jgi:hypothetical protein